MVVDDDHDWVEALLDSLDTLGYETRFAYAALAALEIVTRFKPQMMMIDIEMPGMDGYELVRKLRAMVELGQPRLIAVTGRTHDSDRTRAFEAGFDEHIAPPLDLARLESILAI
jgi:CheY-like chemotaxis protein